MDNPRPPVMQILLMTSVLSLVLLGAEAWMGNSNDPSAADALNAATDAGTEAADADVSDSTPLLAIAPT